MVTPSDWQLPHPPEAYGDHWVPAMLDRIREDRNRRLNRFGCTGSVDLGALRTVPSRQRERRRPRISLRHEKVHQEPFPCSWIGGPTGAAEKAIWHCRRLANAVPHGIS